MLVNKVFTMMQAFQKQKSSQISPRADCHSWQSGLGWQTHARGKPSNDLAKTKNQQFVAAASFSTTIYSGHFIENFSKKRSDCTTNIWNREEQ